MVGGVLDSGCHSEFTVIGDAVNVAQRLEKLAKSLDASLVISSNLVARLQSGSARHVEVCDVSRSAGAEAADRCLVSVASDRFRRRA